MFEVRHLKQQYSGIDGTPGFKVAWEGNKQAGKGEQEIKNIIKNSRIDMEIRFEKPFKNIAQTRLIMEDAAPGSNVEWVLEGKNNYPLNLMNPFVGKLLGKDMEESLGNLKKILEGNV